MLGGPSRYHLVYKTTIRWFKKTPNGKLVLDQMICALSARLDQKLKATFFTSVLIPGSSSWAAFASYWYNNIFFFFIESMGIPFAGKCFIRIITQQCPLLNLLNHFNVIEKLFLWDCRRSQKMHFYLFIYFLFSSCISYFENGLEAVHCSQCKPS